MSCRSRLEELPSNDEDRNEIVDHADHGVGHHYRHRRHDGENVLHEKDDGTEHVGAAAGAQDGGVVVDGVGRTIAAVYLRWLVYECTVVMMMMMRRMHMLRELMLLKSKEREPARRTVLADNVRECGRVGDGVDTGVGGVGADAHLSSLLSLVPLPQPMNALRHSRTRRCVYCDVRHTSFQSVDVRVSVSEDSTLSWIDLWTASHSPSLASSSSKQGGTCGNAMGYYRIDWK